MFDRIRASRLVALGLAYGVAALLVAGVVAVQSGLNAAMVVFGTNLVLAAGPIGFVWAGGRMAERFGVRGWWSGRLVGDLIGLVALFTLVYFGLSALEWFFPGPRVGWVGPEAFVDPVLGAAALLTVVNVVPLSISLGLEALARR